MTHFHKLLFHLLLVSGLSAAVSVPARAIDLIPDIFKTQEKFNSEIWREQEQFVALAAQGAGASGPNDHPAQLDPNELRDALRSLQLWSEGGLIRDEQSAPLLSAGQAEALARNLAIALTKAKPGEDVAFNLRGYTDVAFDTAKERSWTSGRAFYVAGRLNLIIGSYQVKKDRGKRNAEASFGIMNDYSDMYFDTASRSKSSSKMPGRVVATDGVGFHGDGDSVRTDWMLIDIKRAAVAFREGQTPEEEKKREKKAQQDAAKLTLERREMREEMARLRQELKQLKSGSAASNQSAEERLKTLLDLKQKKLITEDEYLKRRAQILNEL